MSVSHCQFSKFPALYTPLHICTTGSRLFVFGWNSDLFSLSLLLKLFLVLGFLGLPAPPLSPLTWFPPSKAQEAAASRDASGPVSSIIYQIIFVFFISQYWKLMNTQYTLNRLLLIHLSYVTKNYIWKGYRIVKRIDQILANITGNTMRWCHFAGNTISRQTSAGFVTQTASVSDFDVTGTCISCKMYLATSDRIYWSSIVLIYIFGIENHFTILN